MDPPIFQTRSPEPLPAPPAGALQRAACGGYFGAPALGEAPWLPGHPGSGQGWHAIRELGEVEGWDLKGHWFPFRGCDTAERWFAGDTGPVGSGGEARPPHFSRLSRLNL